MKYFLTFLSVAYLSSCASIPIPPTGEHQGKLGAIKLSFSYVPYSNPDTKDSNVKFAWENFSKTLKDK